MQIQHNLSRAVVGAATASVLASFSIAAAQSTLDIAATSGGASTVFVTPGQPVDYEVNILLGGDASQGLAMFAFDLGFTGGDLTTQAIAPNAGGLAQFVSPLGLNNPEGYGGTMRDGDLLQIGGAMNTIANSFAPAPSGVVATGVANAAAAEVATGSLTAPMTPGSYELQVSNVFANVLDTQAPSGYWIVRPADAGTPGVLNVVVLDCVADTYCTGKMNSLGCTPSVAVAGVASVGGSSAVTVTATDVVNGQTGLFVWSRSEGSMPLFGGTLCVGQPLMRMLEPARSGGTGTAGTNCEGTFTRTIDASFIAAGGLLLGETMHCQWIYRDPANADGTGAGLTNGARFTICP